MRAFPVTGEALFCLNLILSIGLGSARSVENAGEASRVRSYWTFAYI